VLKDVYLPGDRAFIRFTEIPGDDPPLLWLHGLMCSSTGELIQAAVQPELRGRRQLLIDFLGYGYSDRPMEFGYTPEDHTRTIVAVIDALGLTDCCLIGHSMGGGVAILVASARPQNVSLLVMAEGRLDIDFDGPDPIAAQSEKDFVDHGFADLLEGQTRDAEALPEGLRAAHLGITRLVAPYALHRAEVARGRETDPPLRSLLKDLQMPRWYLDGAESEPWGPRDDLEDAGVEFKVIQDTGHMMALQNPRGLAATIAEILTVSWQRHGPGVSSV
jgi:pimeloyl-ACP methyl ester carboxylesterase